MVDGFENRIRTACFKTQNLYSEGNLVKSRFSLTPARPVVKTKNRDVAGCSNASNSTFRSVSPWSTSTLNGSRKGLAFRFAFTIAFAVTPQLLVQQLAQHMRHTILRKRTPEGSPSQALRGRSSDPTRGLAWCFFLSSVCDALRIQSSPSPNRAIRLPSFPMAKRSCEHGAAEPVADGANFVFPGAEWLRHLGFDDAPRTAIPSFLRPTSSRIALGVNSRRATAGWSDTSVRFATATAAAVADATARMRRGRGRGVKAERESIDYLLLGANKKTLFPDDQEETSRKNYRVIFVSREEFGNGGVKRQIFFFRSCGDVRQSLKRMLRFFSKTRRATQRSRADGREQTERRQKRQRERGEWEEEGTKGRENSRQTPNRVPRQVPSLLTGNGGRRMWIFGRGGKGKHDLNSRDRQVPSWNLRLCVSICELRYLTTYLAILSVCFSRFFRLCFAACVRYLRQLEVWDVSLRSKQGKVGTFTKGSAFQVENEPVSLRTYLNLSRTLLAPGQSSSKSMEGWCGSVGGANAGNRRTGIAFFRSGTCIYGNSTRRPNVFVFLSCEILLQDIGYIDDRLAWGIHLVTPRPDYRMRNREGSRQVRNTSKVTTDFPRDTLILSWKGVCASPLSVRPFMPN
ncbi:hypothetical protein CCUS01_13253 [Colletotrichum cuscutae]|uniref:Uncharacterized protein n=1 Tax=Colletotrichum cuscutae TaxID=1209917 RepID=A0AAJ0DPQ3_9PEZI|nr:hypothetical protein CCUS01_13253 [Colletotrichum cuscutae]